MRIAKIGTYILRHRLEEQKFLSSQCVFGDRNSMLVRIETDDGVEGWGEGGQYGPPEPVATMVESVLKPLLIGKDPCEIDKLWETMYASTRDYGRHSTPVEAISAVDIALWDILGKAWKQPVWKLLGGAFRSKIRLYATGFYYKLSDLEKEHEQEVVERARREAESHLSAGFKAMKMKIGLLSPEQDLERVRVVRKAVGTDALLLVDANHAYNAHVALRVGRELETQKVFWFEEPVVPEDMAGYKHLADSLSLAVAGGECLYTRYGFRDLLAERALDIVQPDICCAGGISEVKKIATMANTWGIQCCPHVWGSGVAVAAATHFLAAMPPWPPTYQAIPGINDPMLEYDRTPNSLRDDLLRIGPVIRDGWIEIPEGNGLGIEIDEKVLSKYVVKQ